MKSYSIFKSFDLGKFIGHANDTVTLVNKALPIYKQVSPLAKNIKKAFNSINSIKKAAVDETIKDIKSFERPLTIFKKNNLYRGNLNLDNLTFFNEK